MNAQTHYLFIVAISNIVVSGEVFFTVLGGYTKSRNRQRADLAIIQAARDFDSYYLKQWRLELAETFSRPNFLSARMRR